MTTGQLIKSKIEQFLSKESFCSLQELNAKSTVYSVNPNAVQPYIKILAYRNCIVVCTSKALRPKVQELLQGKNRDEIFELPLAYGQTIHFVPDTGCARETAAPPGFSFEALFDDGLSSLTGLSGFDNSCAFDENGVTATKAVFLARHGREIIGVAGAAESSESGVWEVGVDVMEAYRDARLGTYLVQELTRELLARDIVPFYSASVTNLGSQMVAARCGYIPCWVDTFGTILDGSSAYPGLASRLSLEAF